MSDGRHSGNRRAFLGAAAAALGVGAVLRPTTLGAAGSTATADSTATEKANVKTVNDMCAAWAAPLDFDRIGRFLSDDCVFRASETAPPVKGREAIVESLKRMLATAQRAEIQVVQSFAKGPIVFNERFDRFTLGERKIDWHGVGVFFLKDEKIAEWSDFAIKDQ
jgi:limonene-1,2-epoxide hydrolase